MNRHALIGSLAAVAALAGSAHAQILPYTYVTTLDASSPTFNRPLDNGTAAPTGLSGVGTNVSYGTFTFIPDTTGLFTLETTPATSLPDGDTYLVLYQGVFNPASPLTNAIEADDDDAPTGFLSSITRNLTAGTSYTLVSTTFDNAVFGSITTQISGPGSLNAAAAPEPGSIALLGLVALPGVALLRRKK